MRRLWEHTQFGQLDPFGLTASTHRDWSPDDVLDILEGDDDTARHTGLTLAALRAGQHGDLSAKDAESLLSALPSDRMVAFRHWVRGRLHIALSRTAVRRDDAPFVAIDRNAPFGVAHLHSRLVQRLLAKRAQNLAAFQWALTIRSFTRSGITDDEIEASGVVVRLLETDGTLTGEQVARLCDFKPAFLSIVPVTKTLLSQLRFVPAGERKFRSLRRRYRASAHEQRSTAAFDPSLGYRVDRVTQQALWGVDTTWQAVDRFGDVVQDRRLQAAFASQRDAQDAAGADARLRMPKQLALGKWQGWAWTGGSEYREWLVTLPHVDESFFTTHFELRNVLLHLRVDVREGATGERILLVQELQSDWADESRLDTEVPRPPFFKEWPRLGLKLALLHAAKQGLDGVAWLMGSQQVERFGGRGRAMLLRLYDHVLPKHAAGILQPFGVSPAPMEVYVPVDFRTALTGEGYLVLSAEGDRLGVAATLEEARAFFPDGGQERLREVAGVRLDAGVRAGVLAQGFAAWG